MDSAACVCASGKTQSGNCITGRQMLFFNSSLQNMKFGLIFWNPRLLFPCPFLALSIWIIGRLDGFSSPGKLGEMVARNTDKEVLSITVKCFMLTNITKPTICHLGYHNHIKHISRLIFDGSVGVIKSFLKKNMEWVTETNSGRKIARTTAVVYIFMSQSHCAWLWLLSIYCLFSCFWKWMSQQACCWLIPVSTLPGEKNSTPE